MRFYWESTEIATETGSAVTMRKSLFVKKKQSTRSRCCLSLSDLCRFKQGRTSPALSVFKSWEFG